MAIKQILYWLLVCVGINRLCSLVPDLAISPFPFYQVEITLQYYVYAISQHLIVMVLLYLVAESAEHSIGSVVNKLFFIEILSLLDFFLIYEHSFVRVFGYGVEFTDIKIILYAYFIVTWKKK